MRAVNSLIRKFAFSRVLASTSKRYIFVFHDVSDPGSPQFSESYSTPPAVFRNQIEFLLKLFHFVSLEDALSATTKPPRRRIACLTFDDGFLSVRDEAFPFLNGKGVPFALFASGTAIKHNRLSNGANADDVTPEYKCKVFLDEDDVRYLSERGVLVGSHSYNHKVLAVCSDEELHHEIAENKIYLESVTGQPVRHIALPFGKREHYNERVVQFCTEAGHDYVYTSNPTYFDPAAMGSKPRLIPRIGLTNQTPAELLFLINRPLLRRIDI